MEPQPHHPQPDDLDAVATLAESLRQALRLARALVGQGRPVDLAGIQDSVGLLCAKALDLPADRGRNARVTLLSLRDEVDQLSATLRHSVPE